MRALPQLAEVTVVIGLLLVGAAPAWAQTVGESAPPPAPMQPDPSPGPQPLLSGELRSPTTLHDQSGTPFESFDSAQLEERLNARFAATQTWMAQAQMTMDADDKRIEVLEQDVQTLETAIAKLQQQQSAGATVDQLSRVEARVTSLEKNRNQVTAPFKVVDSSGKTVMQVDSGEDGNTRGMSLVNSADKLVMFAAAVGSGGVVEVLDSGHEKAFADLVAADGALSIKATPDGGANGAIVSVKESGVTSFEMTGPGGIAASIYGDKDGGALTVYDKDGGPAVIAEASTAGGVVRAEKSGDAQTYVVMGVTDGEEGLKVRGEGKSKAYVGTQPDGSGVAYVFGSTEVPAAGLQSYQNGKGEVAVFNASGTPIAFLDESDKHAGGGNVTLTDPAGNGVFSAGFDGDQGAACVGHKDKLHCLGIGLPGLGSGND